ncbi:MAG: aminopeptidase N [Gammaproteobacteria bacterium]|jgi:aminopeptidase N
MQPIYSLYKFGEAAYTHSMYQSYLGLVNCHPVVMEGVITSDQAFNSDIYSKGGWTFHTLRWLIGDELFWQATRELLYAKAETYNIPYPIAPRYRNTQDFINIVNRLTGEDYTWLFEVYLKQAALPELKQTRTRDKLVLKWQTSDNLAFPMPITISINGKSATYTTIDDQIILEVNKKDHIIIDPKMKVLRYLPIIGLCKENQAKRDKKRS